MKIVVSSGGCPRCAKQGRISHEDDRPGRRVDLLAADREERVSGHHGEEWDADGVSEQSMDVVRQLYDAFNSDDMDRILALTHLDFELEVPPSLSAEPDVYRGHHGMRRYFESFQDAMEEIRWRSERFWDAGESVVVAGVVTAKGRQTAIPVEQRGAIVWTVCDGTVIRVRGYASISEALAAVGLME